MNPYDWNRIEPKVEIPRPEVASVVELLRRGDGGILFAGRGLGKSVFLYQVRRELEKFPDVQVVLFPAPPVDLTVRRCFEALAGKLDVPLEGVFGANDLADAYFSRSGSRKNLVLLYDELDRYARPAHDSSQHPPGRDLFNSLETMRQSFPGVGILAAASIGMYLYRDVLGSNFVLRAKRRRIRPFNRTEMEALAQPFADRGKPLSTETLDALYLASGGHPALATYGLESLWPLPSPTERDVTKAFRDFQEENKEFLRGFQLSFSDSTLSEAPQKVWDVIRASDGSVAREDLQRACGAPKRLLQLDVGDVLDVLEAAGLVRITGSKNADPVIAHPINSILSLPTVPSPTAQLQEQLYRDLRTLLHRLHVSSADFFRPGTTRQGKQLVPEAVFAAFLALGFELLGWRVDREVQRGAGRTDLLLRRASDSAVAVIETKIWGRNDYREAHQQVASYWTAETAAGAVVMVTDAELPDWPERYRETCLTACREGSTASTEPGSPVRTQLNAVSETLEGLSIEIGHFLLRLPRGK